MPLAALRTETARACNKGFADMSFATQAKGCDQQRKQKSMLHRAARILLAAHVIDVAFAEGGRSNSRAIQKRLRAIEVREFVACPGHWR